MHPPTPRACLATVVVVGGGLTIWDIACIYRQKDLPPSQIHQLAVGLVVAAAVVGAIGYWFEHLVELGGDMERARRGDKDTHPTRPTPSNVRQLHGPAAPRQRSTRQEQQLHKRAE